MGFCLVYHLIIYDLFLIILDSDRLAPEIVEEALSKVEEDHDYDYT